MITDLSWWSLKFLRELKASISILAVSEALQIFHNGITWQHFVAPTYVNNLHKDTKVDWHLRTRKFGCFTREELIDNKKYWSIVSQILEKFPDSEFYYTGRSSVHQKWVHACKNLNQRINFLG